MMIEGLHRGQLFFPFLAGVRSMFETRNGQPNRRTVLAVVIISLGLFASRTEAQNPVPFAADFEGDFQILLGAGPGGTDDLRFSGAGLANHLGLSDVDGHSTTLPSPADPLCSDIVTDLVILTAANGDELWLTNSGQDCLDFSVPGRIFIRGSGTMRVLGGTGRFHGATGFGTFEVLAEVTGFVAGGVAGPFALHFEGEIALLEK
jgi:hypothetical protein